jgi:hypothetical protein
MYFWYDIKNNSLHRCQKMFCKVFIYTLLWVAFAEQGWMDCCCSKLPSRYGFNPLESLSENDVESNREELHDESSTLEEDPENFGF